MIFGSKNEKWKQEETEAWFTLTQQSDSEI